MLLRKASNAEVSLYEKVIYPLQDDVLSLAESEKFYLTGGTCLSRFYYRHRYSEDLDFFFLGDTYDETAFSGEFDIIFKRLSQKFPCEIILNDTTFKRLLIARDNVHLKVEFVFEPVKHLGELEKKTAFLSDNSLNIAVNKLTTVYNRKTAKDYFDLFFLLKDYPLDKIYELSKEKMVMLDYESALLALRAPMEGNEVIMLKDVSYEQLTGFMQTLQKKLIENAKHPS